MGLVCIAAQAAGDCAGEEVQGRLKISLQPVADGEGEEEDQGHDEKEDGQPQPTAGEIPVDLLSGGFLLALIYQDLSDHFFNKIVFLIDNVFLIAAVDDPGQICGVGLGHVLIPLQQLDGVPSFICKIRVGFGQGWMIRSILSSM